MNFDNYCLVVTQNRPLLELVNADGSRLYCCGCETPCEKHKVDESKESEYNHT